MNEVKLNADGFCNASYPSTRAVLQAKRASSVQRLAVRRTLFPLMLAVVVLGSFIGGRSMRVHSQVQHLEEMDAEYGWSHETFDRSMGQKPDKLRHWLAGYFGNSIVSDLAYVKLCEGDLNDRQLTFLSGLRHLQSLEIRSDQATDQTLQVISHLPDLRYLTLAGDRFSVFGLLQLRNASNLRKLQLDTQQLTPIELAVLRSQLRVQLKDAQEKLPRPNRILHSAFTPAV